MIDGLLTRGDIVSGEQMAEEIGISRVAVFKRISHLRRLGYRIEPVRGRGYVFRPRFDGLLPLEIKSKLSAGNFGREIHFFEVLSSTQSYLRRMADVGSPEGTVVVALEQNAGKGRAGRRWLSPKGGLWFSLLLRPAMPANEVYKLSLLLGVSVCRALSSSGIDASLKWPNDVLVEGRKICGILLESSAEPDRIEYIVAGIGVNVNFSTAALTEEFWPRSISSLDLLGRRVDRAGLLAEILKNAESRYTRIAHTGFAPIVAEWRSLSCTVGQSVIVRSLGRETRGRALGIGDDGSLLVETKEGVERIYSGDVYSLPPY